MVRKKELQRQLTEKQERLDLMAQRLDAAEQLLTIYRAREQSIVDAMANAQDSAKRCMREAQQKAERIVTDADARGAELIRAAEERSRQMLKDSENAVSEYERLMEQYNAVLERSAAEAAQSAEYFSKLLKEKKVSGGDFEEEVSPLKKKPFLSIDDRELPDPGSDPSVLMRNIYQLQKRDIPDFEPAPRTTPEPYDARRSVPQDMPEAAPYDGGILPPQDRPQDVPDPEYAHYSGGGQPPVPTVSQLMQNPESQPQDEEVSLDALLDEIIQAGEGK